MGPNYYVTPTPPARGPSRKTLFIGAGLAGAIIIAVTLLFSSGGKNISTQLEHLSLRISSLQAVLDDSATTTALKDEELRHITTELGLTLQSSANQLKPLMVDAGLPEKLDANIVASEADTSSATKLKEAGLNNRLDRTYAEVLNQKIVSLRPLVADIYGQTKNTKLRQALSQFDKSLLQTKKRLDKLEF